MPERWSIMVHGGARAIPKAAQAANRAGCLAAVAAGAAVLNAGGDAVAAVVAAVRVLEDDPTFNAGLGAVRNRDGDIELDAAVMDGDTLDVGAVAALAGYANPICVAHALLREDAVLLVGRGAEVFAAGIEAEPAPPRGVSLSAPSCDTVGCVAFDRQGRLAAALSTGGLEGARAGRVGDAAIPGAGLYAEAKIGAVALSGDGESILRLALASRAMQHLQAQNAPRAAAFAMAQLDRVGGEAGCIVLDARGSPGFAHTSDHFAVGYSREGGPARTFIHQDEGVS